MFHQIPAGGDRNFGYLFGDGGEGAAVDPADPDALLAVLRAEGARLRYIIATHGHPDHTAGNAELKRRTGARIVAHARCPGAKDVAVSGGESFELGATRFRLLFTPGHTPDSLCVLWEGRVMTGDTLFVGKVGGTDLDAGARAEYAALHGVLAKLPDETEVWPGHDYGLAPSSTIGREKETNPFWLRPDFDSFVDLKRNWLQYKKEHGIP